MAYSLCYKKMGFIGYSCKYAAIYKENSILSHGSSSPFGINLSMLKFDRENLANQKQCLYRAPIAVIKRKKGVKRQVSEIKSDLSHVKTLTAKLFACKERLLETKGIAPMSANTNLSPNDEMKDVFADSLRLIHHFCACLEKDIERVESIGWSFQERDELLARQMGGHPAKPI